MRRLSNHRISNLSLQELIHSASNALSLFVLAVVVILSLWLTTGQAQAQIPGNALGGGAAAMGIGVGGLGGLGAGGGVGAIPAVGGLTNNMINGADPLDPAQNMFSNVSFKPLAPNEFQKYVLEVTGQHLSLFGVSFFENSYSNALGTQVENATGLNNPKGYAQVPFASYTPSINTPVSADYALGAGDQLLIRTWGSLDVNFRAVLDRNGLISIPKIGTIALSGVKISNAEAVIKQAIDKYYKNYELNVSMGQTRGITVYVVGQARRPGSYNLSAMSTISTALFATGGPNANGSMRRVLLKRNGQVIAEFDLYQFLAFGLSQGDTKLVDGDVLVVQPSFGYVALTGKLNVPAVYELKSNAETLSQILEVAGGLPVTASTRLATLDRLDASQRTPRSVSSVNLDTDAKSLTLKSGDLLTFYPLSNELANAVTLKGHVAQPMRMPWRGGLKISDLIPNREVLITKDFVRTQTEVLFSANEKERTQRAREAIPTDLIQDLRKDQELAHGFNTETGKVAAGNSNAGPLSNVGMQGNGMQGQGQALALSPAQMQTLEDAKPEAKMTLEQWNQKREARLVASLPEVATSTPTMIANNLGRMVSLPNFNYAVVERVGKQDLNIQVIPFNLGKVLDDPQSSENLSLEPGDVVTIFAQEDLNFPKSKQRVLVQIEGEVKQPGVYPVNPGETLPEFIERVGGLTPDAYLFGTALYRDEVRKSQLDNLIKLLRNLEAQSSATLSQMSQSLGASTNPGIVQAKISAAQQAQQSALQRLKNLKPEGRIALGTTPSLDNGVVHLPNIRLSNNDRIKIPARPDFVYVFGSVNTESALIYKSNWKVSDYLELAGIGSASDKKASILIRADGTALTSNSFWSNEVLNAKVLPGDTIVLPEKADQETVWSTVVRNTMDYTQIFYQFGLGAAAIKTLRQ